MIMSMGGGERKIGEGREREGRETMLKRVGKESGREEEEEIKKEKLQSAGKVMERRRGSRRARKKASECWRSRRVGERGGQGMEEKPTMER
jgi:hypothetical protein